ncbi:aminopeptidase P family protein [Cohaesibacter celericrescens]|uniref:X-Pro aminopeptidase n=1 Tax=Cohaesibacter celericrescens TaxID=2067669 RepID=A0A2N5XWQ0_9HYPH|nr:aminopeptidase P family protein [Cohaesibacter celericrescens]PLW75536.1 X-Pro aminopeptidase [Cohaesibacter celericrescens]PLW78943.1 X-Pro aminopeptidase [Cohaesibacter celericrescens]
MFQEFSDQACPEQGRVRLPLLREELQEQGLSGFIVPRADEYGGENLAPYAERLSWLTGFTGSAGTSVILKTKAAVFIDGRYTLQVRDQVDTELLTPISVPQSSVSKWLEANLSSGDVIGFDPWLHGSRDVARLQDVCEKAGAELKACETNPIDAIWTNQPERPKAPIVPHPMSLAGQTAEEKLNKISKQLQGKADATFITQGDSIAWLLNIRGSDVPRAPLPLAFAIVTAASKAILLIDPSKLTAETRAHLPDSITIEPLDNLPTIISNLAASVKNWMLDDQLVPFAVRTIIEATGAEVVIGQDLCLKPKSAKNKAELAGMRTAHLRDGIAMCNFLAWLDTMAPTDSLDEIAAASALEHFRSASGCLKDISFETISGAGPNGAIVHYRVSEASNRKFDQNSLFLVDSGGQYPDGTTDITRTIAIGTPDTEMKDRFTRVLKGMIAVSMARFPKGANGAQLDTLARMPLWQAGLDYAHGTGHGVGSYLCVHEGPQRISKAGAVPLETGNILSNEPGYYKTGAWGIRIENLLAVTEPETIKDGEDAMHAFETLTLCPIDHRLVDARLLTQSELDWFNDYHERVFAELSGDLDEKTRAWLAEATKPLHKS